MSMVDEPLIFHTCCLRKWELKTLRTIISLYSATNLGFLEYGCTIKKKKKKKEKFVFCGNCRSLGK